ncbi:hypothetical protein CEXT_1521 [Caerostris extrusa]|uniref:Uncharacterized protein n=1 Tax=Caerostris extrusa TaxID=172846 RepID=A0AAV4VN65_CAEEX|nr:hypothetical protein CEXT_1521 [Caerostris extrusa]
MTAIKERYRELVSIDRSPKLHICTIIYDQRATMQSLSPTNARKISLRRQINRSGTSTASEMWFLLRHRGRKQRSNVSHTLIVMIKNDKRKVKIFNHTLTFV